MIIHIDFEQCEKGIKDMYDTTMGYIQHLDNGKIFLNRLNEHTSNSIETNIFIENCNEILKINQRFLAQIEEYAQYLKGTEIKTKIENGHGIRKKDFELFK